MAKVSKIVMEQFIKGLSIDNNGDVEIPSSVARGMFHLIIKNEIIDYLKAYYTEPISLYSADTKKISSDLGRNTAQVIYYIREIANDKIMNIRFVGTDSSATTRVVRKLKKYFTDRGENTPVSIYEVAQAIEENVSTIYAVNPNTTCIVLNSRACGYDDRGRKARTIRLSNNAYADALRGM